MKIKPISYKLLGFCIEFGEKVIDEYKLEREENSTKNSKYVGIFIAHIRYKIPNEHKQLSTK